MLTVYLAGIMYFHGCEENNKRALVPNGTKGMGKIPRHHASFWVEPDQWEADDWFRGQKLDREVTVVNDDGDEVKVHVYEYRIPFPAELTFPDENDAPATFVNLTDGLPKIKELDPQFEVDFEKPDTIAQIRFRGGQLKAFEFKKVAVVQWTIAKAKSLKITATTGRETKFITLKNAKDGPGPEIVFSNTSDLLDSHDEDEDREHFKLYSKINVSRRADGLKAPDPRENLKELPHDHDYLAALANITELPEPGCEGTCC